MAVSLYTVRVVLSALGVVDYGIYNVVAGVVSMFGFLSGTMASASQRFFAYELGKQNIEKLKKTFSITVLIYIGIAILIVVLAETVGLWFLYNKMTIPSERFSSALWVYQFSIASFVVTIMAIPYNAAIVAKENMKVFAVVGIVEVLLKLAIVYLLLIFNTDKLKLYALLLFISNIIIRFIYSAYCRRVYNEFRFELLWDADIFKKLVGYSGWNLFGAIASVLNNQGVNILLNIFFNPVVNAARGVAMQISNAVNQFVQNFMMASRPQITKYYAEKNLNEMFDLVFKSSKFSFFLIAILSMPILIKMEFVLSLWLKLVPDYTVIFSRLILIVAMIDSFSYSLMASAQATGKIRNYQIIVGGVLMLNVPISYLFLKMGFQPEWTLYIAIFISIVCLILRLVLLNKMLNFPMIKFMIKSVILPMFAVVLGIVIPIMIHINSAGGLFVNILLFGMIYLLSISLSIYFVGLSRSEKKYIIKKIKK